MPSKSPERFNSVRLHAVHILIGLFMLIITTTGCDQNTASNLDDSSNAGEGKQSTQSLPPGQELFLNHCMGCHMGAGNPPGPDERISKSEKLASLDVFKAYIRQPDNMNMPPIGPEQITDEQLSTLYDYLKTATPQ